MKKLVTQCRLFLPATTSEYSTNDSLVPETLDFDLILKPIAANHELLDAMTKSAKMDEIRMGGLCSLM